MSIIRDNSILHYFSLLRVSNSKDISFTTMEWPVDNNFTNNQNIKDSSEKKNKSKKKKRVG